MSAFRNVFLVAALAAVFPALTAPAQEPSPAARPSFDVASVKPVVRTVIQLNPQRSGGRISWQAGIFQMLSYAYHLPFWRIKGPPPTGISFQIEATAADASATTDQIRLMFQSLLATRFQLAAHFVPTEVNGYSLTLGKGGLKIKESKPDDPPAALPAWFAGKEAMIPRIEGTVRTTAEGRGITAVTARRVSMTEVADALQQSLATLVTDRTGLTGKYYFGIKFLDNDAPSDADAPTLNQALQEFGLHLEKEKGRVDILYIDHIEKMPTGN